MGSVNLTVAVREAYRGYRPPFDFKATVEKLLATVPGKYLIGLDCVVLINQSGLPRRDRVGKIRSRNRKVDKLTFSVAIILDGTVLQHILSFE